MYEAFFGLQEAPFSITPDPRYLFPSARHTEALGHLFYGVSAAGGFIQLTGEVGTGKTTVVRSLLAREPVDVDIALVLNPRVTVTEFLQTLCEELGVTVAPESRQSVKSLVDVLTARLLDAHAAGRRVAVLIDEAHLLERDVLEQVRLLTNIETSTRKLLQIILIGQPELRELLAREDMRQVAQRITGRLHLDSLSSAETAAYVRHRLRVAGATREIFTPSALRELHRQAQGLPRLINVIADRAMLGAFSQDRHEISARLVRDAAAEVSGIAQGSGLWAWILAAASLLVIAGGAWFLWRSLAGN
jgi:general secretion pathway protein A